MTLKLPTRGSEILSTLDLDSSITANGKQPRERNSFTTKRLKLIDQLKLKQTKNSWFFCPADITAEFISTKQTKIKVSIKSEMN